MAFVNAYIVPSWADALAEKSTTYVNILNICMQEFGEKQIDRFKAMRTYTFSCISVHA